MMLGCTSAAYTSGMRRVVRATTSKFVTEETGKTDQSVVQSKKKCCGENRANNYEPLDHSQSYFPDKNERRNYNLDAVHIAS